MAEGKKMSWLLVTLSSSGSCLIMQNICFNIHNGGVVPCLGGTSFKGHRLVLVLHVMFGGRCVCRGVCVSGG